MLVNRVNDLCVEQYRSQSTVAEDNLPGSQPSCVALEINPACNRHAFAVVGHSVTLAHLHSHPLILLSAVVHHREDGFSLASAHKDLRVRESRNENYSLTECRTWGN